MYIDYKVGEASSGAVMSCLRELTARRDPRLMSPKCAVVSTYTSLPRLVPVPDPPFPASCRPSVRPSRPSFHPRRPSRHLARTDQCRGLDRDSHCPTETDLTSPAHQPDKRQDDGSSAVRGAGRLSYRRHQRILM